MLGNLRAFGNIIRATKPVVFVFINSGLSLQIELDVTVCKTYNYMMKAMKAEPYFVATYEGKFSSKCDDILLSQQNAAASSTKATSKARKTTHSAAMTPSRTFRGAWTLRRPPAVLVMMNQKGRAWPNRM